MGIFIYYFSFVFIFTVWAVYPLILWLLQVLVKKNGKDISDNKFSVSVIIAAHNEESNIKARIINVLSLDMSIVSNLEIIVVSDASTDRTLEAASSISDPRVICIDNTGVRGRASAHNEAIKVSKNEILVFTDAETSFDDMFLTSILKPFHDERIGMSTGLLKYCNQHVNKITESSGLYWRFENYLRRNESSLGVGITSSGACCAVRRKLYLDIPPTGDVDFTTPLDVVLQGYRCVHSEDAIAYELMPDTPELEFRARIRMTSKNLYGTVTRWGFKGLYRHPVYSLVLLFHKIGRWLTPFAMICLLISNVVLIGSGMGYDLFFIGQLLFYLVAAAGYYRLPIPLAGQAYSFCLANIGFLIGVLKAITGHVPTAYKPINRG